MQTPLDPEEYRSAWKSQATYRGFHKCVVCGAMDDCAGRTRARMFCLACFAERAFVEARRMAKRVRRAARAKS